MADWFKFYENDLDETRLQYAISKMPEVVSVWVGILSEACRHKQGTISWGDDSIELFGFSRRLGLSMPKVNEGVNLLCEIRYISKSDNFINILKWNEKQSEYCRWKEKKTDAKKESVPRVSLECPPRGEERRVDKNRVEESRADKKEVAPLPRFQKPSVESIKLQSAKIGLTDIEADKFFNYYESNGWRVGKNPMRSWVHALTNWKNHAQNYGQQHQNYGRTSTSRPITPVKGSTQVGGF